MIGKRDKNLVFTPDHICDFICKALGVGKHSRILDPCCGDGTFLIRAMTNAINDCETNDERDDIIKNHIYGIEFDNNVFDLATTNMINHGCEVSNIVHNSMFNCSGWIENANINIVFINPPYNATKQNCNPEYIKSWKTSQKEDPSKGFHFVEWVCDHVSSNCKVAALLPMQAAIGNSDELKKYKKRMLEKYTLDAVLSFPPDMFYPVASSDTCCMIFDLSNTNKKTNKDTFFGYFKDDGFVKKKLCRIEKKTNIWFNTENKWLDLYLERKSEKGFSALKSVDYDDEWLAEAYMETDYTLLNENNFKTVLNEYRSYLIKSNYICKNMFVDTSSWKSFYIGGENGIFELENCKCSNAGDLLEYGDDIEYIGAKKTENGIMYTVKIVESLVTKGNCIIFICDGQGSVGYTNYIDHDFIGSTTLTVGRNPNINKWNGLFLVTVLDCERYRYSFGRKYKTNLYKSKIKLPVDVNGEPDWQFMENYIKSLSYDDRIQDLKMLSTYSGG